MWLTDSGNKFWVGTDWAAVCQARKFRVRIWGPMETAPRVVQTKGRGSEAGNENGGREVGSPDGVR